MITEKEFDKVNGLKEDLSQIEDIIDSFGDTLYVTTTIGLLNRYNRNDKTTLMSLDVNNNAKWFEENCHGLIKELKEIAIQRLKKNAQQIKDEIAKYIEG